METECKDRFYGIIRDDCMILQRSAAVMAANVGAIFLTAFDFSGREFTQIGREGTSGCPRIRLGRGATHLRGTGSAFNVKLAYSLPCGKTAYGTYTGGFSYDTDKGSVRLLDDYGSFRSGQTVNCARYDRGYDSIFVSGVRFG